MTSKLGPHCLGGVPVTLAAGTIAKLVSGFGDAPTLLAANPRLTLIGRLYTPVTLLEKFKSGESPEAAATEFVNSQKAVYQANSPFIKLWEGHNEPSFGGPDDPQAVAGMAWYARFEVTRIRIMADLGFRCVIGNFSTGYPEVPQYNGSLWNAFLPALQAAQLYNGVLGLHEYSAPWIWWMTGQYQEQPGDSGDEGWTTLRYRKIYRQVLKPNNINIQIAITEMGWDAVGHNPPGSPSGNWRTCAGWWNAANSSNGPIPYNSDNELFAAEQLIWYDRELQKDPYVIGATVFTFGTGGDATWNGYNLFGTRVASRLAEHMLSQTGVPTTPPPTTDPTNPTPPSQGDTTMKQPLSFTLFNTMDFDIFRNWDATSNAAENHLAEKDYGNGILLPTMLNCSIVTDPGTRVTWLNQVLGAKDNNGAVIPVGATRTQEWPFNKMECKPLSLAEATDIRAANNGKYATSDMLKMFGDHRAIYTTLFAPVTGFVVGGTYELAAPLFPDMVSGYDSQNAKVYANDPAAAMMLLDAMPGNVEPPIFAQPTDLWYDGSDSVYGEWKEFAKVFTATSETMTLVLRLCGVFALQNVCWFMAPLRLRVISTPSNPQTGEPPAGTGLLAQFRIISTKASALQDDIDDLHIAVENAESIIGS